jgi:hypothetical protein
MSTPAPLTETELDKWFPLQRPAIKPGVFEIGIALGGTVSAGAYTGGVVDYLMEALDGWTRAKEGGDPLAPQHEVVISTMAGASGGAINGAILLRAAGWDFDHGPVDGNPFYASWTKGVALAQSCCSSRNGTCSRPKRKIPGLSISSMSMAARSTMNRSTSYGSRSPG